MKGLVCPRVSRCSPASETEIDVWVLDDNGRRRGGGGARHFVAADAICRGGHRQTSAPPPTSRHGEVAVLLAFNFKRKWQRSLSTSASACVAATGRRQLGQCRGVKGRRPGPSSFVHLRGLPSLVPPSPVVSAGNGLSSAGHRRLVRGKGEARR